jgi:hypothetical protein
MSRLTRTGLLLIPWLPLFIAGLAIYAVSHPDPAIIGTDCWSPPSVGHIAMNISFWFVALPTFVVGALLLLFAGTRHLVRLRRRSA